MPSLHSPALSPVPREMHCRADAVQLTAAASRRGREVGTLEPSRVPVAWGPKGRVAVRLASQLHLLYVHSGGAIIGAANGADSAVGLDQLVARLFEPDASWEDPLVRVRGRAHIAAQFRALRWLFTRVECVERNTLVDPVRPESVVAVDHTLRFVFLRCLPVHIRVHTRCEFSPVSGRVVTHCDSWDVLSLVGNVPLLAPGYRPPALALHSLESSSLLSSSSVLCTAAPSVCAVDASSACALRRWHPISGHIGDSQPMDAYHGRTPAAIAGPHAPLTFLGPITSLGAGTRSGARSSASRCL